MLLHEAATTETYTDEVPLEETPTITVVRTLHGGKPRKLRRIPAEEVGADPGGRMQLRLPMEEVFRDLKAERVTLHLILEGSEGRPSRPGKSVDVVRGEPPAPPVAISAANEEAGVRLSWQPPADVATTLEYHVYRREDAAGPWEGPLGGPMSGTTYLDRDVQFQHSYEYQVRSLAVKETPVRESDAAQPVSVRREDRYPPEPPTAVRAVAVPGGIRVFWFPPESADLAGFHLYRAMAGKRQLLVRLPAHSTFHIDEDVTPGVVYTYSVSALDGAEPPNESRSSEPTEEIATEAEAEPDE
jgi:hypothetical protein